MKKTLSIVLALIVALGLLAGCGSTPATSEPATSEPAVSEPAAGSEPAGGDDTTPFKAAMVTDVGGINDESFNQSAWSGMEDLKADFGVETSFMESSADADYAPNLEKLTDNGNDIVWAIGFLMKDAIREAAEANPDQLYALVDDSFEDGELPNVISVMFNAEHSSFLAGYAAAHKTETDHVGLVLGMESPTMARFTYGYFAGVDYGAKELGKEIQIDYQVAEAFDDPAKGKALAQAMYTGGADVIYSVAGFTGNGCIEAAAEMDKMVIGVDLDQNALAPNNVICSGLKNVGTAIYGITQRVMDGEQLGGTTIYMGITEGGAGLATTGGLLGAELEGKVADLETEIAAGNIEVPFDEAGYTAFKGSL